MVIVTNSKNFIHIYKENSDSIIVVINKERRVGFKDIQWAVLGWHDPMFSGPLWANVLGWHDPLKNRVRLAQPMQTK